MQPARHVQSAFPAWGAAGGRPGTPNYFIVERTSATPQRLSKAAALPLARGDVVRIHTGSGGGFGDPLERDPDAVARDVREAFVSAQRGRDVYGVVMTDGGEVDVAATARLRNELRARR